MIRSITALAIFGLLGAAIVALPAFAPQVKASETITLAKGGSVGDSTDCAKLFAAGLAQLRRVLFA
jgi:hypothetical protein